MRITSSIELKQSFNRLKKRYETVIGIVILDNNQAISRTLFHGDNRVVDFHHQVTAHSGAKLYDMAYVVPITVKMSRKVQSENTQNNGCVDRERF